MRNAKMPVLFAMLLICTFAGPSFGQQRVFNWLPANDESVRLDPAYFHTARTYRPGPDGGNNHVDIKAQKPITIFMTPAEDWNLALQHLESIVNLRRMFPRADASQVHDALEMLQRQVPVLRWRHENRDRLLRLDVHMIVPAIRPRAISPRRVEVRRVQAHAFVIGRQPIKHSLLSKRRPSKRADQQHCEKDWHFGVSHGNSIETRRPFARKDLARNCLLEVS